MHKALVNLGAFLYFIYSVTAVQSEITGTTETTGNTKSEVYCPAEKFNTTEYGIFNFPSSPGSLSGVHVKASCPHGFADNGMVPMEGVSTKMYISKDIRLQESGGHRTCYTDGVNGTPVGRWEPANTEKDRGKMVVLHCRSSAAVNAAAQVNASVMTISAYTFRQILPRLRILQVHASVGDFSCAKTLVDSISQVLANFSLFDNHDLKEEKNALFGLLDEYSKEANLLPGYKVKVENPQLAIETAQFNYTTFNVNNGEISISDYGMEIENVKLNLPAEAIRMSLDQGVARPKLKFTAYGEDLLFHWKDTESVTTPTSNLSSGDQGSPIPAKTAKDIIGNWRVFSVDLIDATIANLTTEFEYIIYLEKDANKYSWECVYWDASGEKWSTKGMRTYQMGNAVICKSTHLTAFSLLIDPLPLPFPGSDYAPIQNSIHSHILAILSSLGSALSIIGLVGTVLTYGLFRVLRKERSNRLLLCLSVSLLGLHLLSITSEKHLWNNKCFIPSSLLHYFLHASLWWMLMEAHHMHQLLISVFVKPESHFIPKRAVLSWGVPLIIVSICAAVQPEVYTAGRNDLCVIAAHLNLPLYYIAYLSPAVIILGINCFVFCRIFNVLYKQTVRQNKEKRRAKEASKSCSQKPEDQGQFHAGRKSGGKITYVMLSPAQIKGAMTVMILVGVGWVVGLLAIGPFEVFFKYLFCICNAGQGAMIFLFRVALHPQACRQWRKTILGFSAESGEVSTTSSTSLSNNQKLGVVTPTFISASNSVENSLTPSNPAAQDLANTLASMLRNPDNQKVLY